MNDRYEVVGLVIAGFGLFVSVLCLAPLVLLSSGDKTINATEAALLMSIGGLLGILLAAIGRGLLHKSEQTRLQIAP